VHQHDGAVASRASREPTVNGGAAGAEKFHVFNRQAGRRIANRMIRRRHEDGTDVPKENNAQEDRGHQQRAKRFPTPEQFHWTLDIRRWRPFSPKPISEFPEPWVIHLLRHQIEFDRALVSVLLAV